MTGIDINKLKNPAAIANMLAFLEYPRHEIVGALVEHFPDCKAEELAERAIGDYERAERASKARVALDEKAIEEEHDG